MVLKSSFDEKYVASGLPALKVGEPLVGIDDMDVRDHMDAHVYHLLVTSCKNKKKKAIKLQLKKSKK